MANVMKTGLNWIHFNRFSSLLLLTMIRISVYTSLNTHTHTHKPHTALLSDLTAMNECVFNPHQRSGQQGQGSRTLISTVSALCINDSRKNTSKKRKKQRNCKDKTNKNIEQKRKKGQQKQTKGRNNQANELKK